MDSFAGAAHPHRPVVVIGAGIGGLVAAARLAAAQVPVHVFEAAASPGGKLRQLEVDGRLIDAGPTVLTMRWVFDELFDDLGAAAADRVELDRAEILARHAWAPRERLDLFANIERSAEAIGRFSGAAEARRFRAFCDEARRIYRTLEGPFLRGSKPDPVSLARRVGLGRLRALWGIQPFARLWGALGVHFQDGRLRQLFGRYATYCGSSPFESPATLMLIAHVEQQGVWLVKGGMHRLAVAIEALGRAHGARFHYNRSVGEIVAPRGQARAVRLSDGEVIDAAAVIVNADANAVACGAFGPDARAATRRQADGARSLSAMTWAIHAPTTGFPLVRHNVFFSSDYRKEFDALFGRGAAPAEPTVYVCAQDRGASEAAQAPEVERLLCLINAPADGDRRRYGADEIERCSARAFARLEQCGLRVRRRPQAERVTTPSDFHRLFPATGGALYGAASHGWRASFSRSGARGAVQGVYFAGGSVHPGPGVPMAALSGNQAAMSVLQDLGAS